jgi:LacI family transcriptional regulator
MTALAPRFCPVGSFDSAYFFSDSMAIPGIRALASSGCRLPQDVAIVGTDNLFWGAFSIPSLTTMDLQEALFALRIADDLDAAGRGSPWSGITTRIPVTLIPRESA